MYPKTVMERKPIIIVVIILVILGGAFYYSRFYKSNSAAVKTGPAKEMSTVPTGKLVMGFPTGLIFPPSSLILKSVEFSATTTEGSLIVIETDYTSASSSNDILKAYIKYATTQNYPILHSALNPDGSRLIVIARPNDNDVFSVAITDPGVKGLRKVVVTLTKHA